MWATSVDLCLTRDPLEQGPSEISGAPLGQLSPHWHYHDCLPKSLSELHSYQVANPHRHGPQDQANH